MWVGYLIATFSVFRGLRFPTDWTYTQFLVNYQFGFAKRGLIGELIRTVGTDFLYSYSFFFIIAITVFIVNCLLIAYLLKKMHETSDDLMQFSALLFVSSFAFTMLADTIAYAEQFGLLVSLLSLFILNFHKKLIFIMACSMLLLFIHEVNIVLFFPFLFTSLLLDMKERDVSRACLLLWWIFGLSLAFSALWVSNLSMDQSSVDALAKTLSLKMELPLRHAVLNVLHRDIQGNWALMHGFWNYKQFLMTDFESFIVTIPSAIVLLFVLDKKLKYSPYGPLMKAMPFFAAASPLLLHALALDFNRWNSLFITVSFLMLYDVFKRQVIPQEIIRSSRFISLVILLIYINGVSSLYLLGNFYSRQFPFLAGFIDRF